VTRGFYGDLRHAHYAATDAVSSTYNEAVNRLIEIIIRVRLTALDQEGHRSLRISLLDQHSVRLTLTACFSPKDRKASDALRLQ